ncbi:unnamed protein product [Brugia timori]|uniref:30S ribosomal protein S8 n=1 Tax=Brugia timori TaxID=42155 RepID=A0A0R3Q6N8_9BILA|nr:unnamed protein product [Brugia timori]
MSADETTCVKPRKLQGAINTIVSKYTDGRSFVRLVFFFSSSYIG